MPYPVLEGQRFGLIATVEEEVQARLGEHRHLLNTAGGPNGSDPLPLIGNLIEKAGVPGITQRFGYVLGDDPRCPRSPPA